jgi:hypothetical protein
MAAAMTMAAVDLDNRSISSAESAGRCDGHC